MQRVFHKPTNFHVHLPFASTVNVPSVPTVSEVTAKPLATTRCSGPAALFVKARFKAFCETSRNDEFGRRNDERPTKQVESKREGPK